jgi:hypothetical protein
MGKLDSTCRAPPRQRHPDHAGESPHGVGHAQQDGGVARGHVLVVAVKPRVEAVQVGFEKSKLLKATRFSLDGLKG